MALGDAGQEDFPDAGIPAKAHRIAPPVPFVEIADDGDAPGVRRPDGEMEAVDAFERHRMGAHLVEEAKVRALADIVVVHRAEDRAEAVGVRHHPLAALIAGAVADRLELAQGNLAGEDARRMDLRQRADLPAGKRFGGYLRGAGQEAAGDVPVAVGMGAEDGEGVPVPSFQDCVDVRLRQKL